MAGVTSTGFVPKTLGELRTEIGTGLRAVFGAAINLDSRSRFGQIRDLVANQLATLWELGETLAGSFDPAGASGVLLDNLAALTNTHRRPAAPSLVDLFLTGADATLIATGRRARVDGTTVTFETVDDVTLALATVWGAGAIVAGNVRSSDGAIWYALTAGTAAVAPTGDGPTFVDGTITWQRMGDGLAYGVALEAEATENGPLQGYAGTVTVIDTPVAGWEAVTNLLDAIPGRLLETDAALRVRRQNEIAAIGNSSVPAIYAKLLKVAGVEKVTVFENTTDSTVDGLTPHSIEALVEGGADADIREAIFAAAAGGIETCGNVSGSVVDEAGNSQTIKFSRVAQVNIWVKYELTVNPGEFPTDGADQVAAALVAWGDALPAGRDAVAQAIAARAFSIPGVLDGLAKIKTSAGPTLQVTIPISVRQHADYDTSRIEVVTTPGVP